MSNQRLMKAKEKAGDGYAKTNAIGEGLATRASVLLTPHSACGTRWVAPVPPRAGEPSPQSRAPTRPRRDPMTAHLDNPLRTITDTLPGILAGAP